MHREVLQYIRTWMKGRVIYVQYIYIQLHDSGSWSTMTRAHMQFTLYTHTHTTATALLLVLLTAQVLVFHDITLQHHHKGNSRVISEYTCTHARTHTHTHTHVYMCTCVRGYVAIPYLCLSIIHPW